jgi:hypothetical protein
MKTEHEINELLSKRCKDWEKAIGIKIRNGQTIEGIKKTLYWVKSDLYEVEYNGNNN